MSRPLVVAVALLAMSTGIAFARSDASHATLVKAPKEHSFIADDVAWRCDGTSCMTVSEINSSAPSLCRALVRQAGPVSSFDKFTADELDKCNGKHK